MCKCGGMCKCVVSKIFGKLTPVVNPGRLSVVLASGVIRKIGG